MLVTSKLLPLSAPFVTADGFVLKQPVVAYEEYGPPTGPVIVVLHGGLSGHHAAGRYDASDPLPGWWDGLIGPGKALDTGRYRVISPNMLGSSWGTTGPTSIDPDTGQPYGPTFPNINFIDVVRFVRAFLDELKVPRVHLAAGPSMGSLAALQLAALYPGYVGAVLAVATAGYMTPSGMSMHHIAINALRLDPQFKGGWYGEQQPTVGLQIVMQVARIYYTYERLWREVAAQRLVDGPGVQLRRSEAVNRFLVADPVLDLRQRDANSLIMTLQAVNTYDLGADASSYAEGVARIVCPVLMINFDTDGEFPPDFAEELAALLNERRSGQAQVCILSSIWGHLGCVREYEKMSEPIRSFLRHLQPAESHSASGH